MRQRQPRSSAAGTNRARIRRLVPALGGLCLMQALAACVGYEKPDLALEIPDHYRTARQKPDAALPALDWWRGFRSRELTTLIEAAQTANLDIAAAVARIVQADAQVRIAGAPLLPVVDFNGSAQRSRQGSAGSSTRLTTRHR